MRVLWQIARGAFAFIVLSTVFQIGALVMIPELHGSQYERSAAQAICASALLFAFLLEYIAWRRHRHRDP